MKPSTWYAASILVCLAALVPGRAPAGTCLEALGTAHAANLFNADTALGAVADAYGQGLYSEKEARRLVERQLALIETVDGHLETLAEADSTRADDRDTIAALRAAYTALRKEGRALRAYLESNSDDDLATWRRARQAAGERIETLTGRDEPAADEAP